jgi:hypothetical protein
MSFGRSSSLSLPTVSIEAFALKELKVNEEDENETMGMWVHYLPVLIKTSVSAHFSPLLLV